MSEENSNPLEKTEQQIIIERTEKAFLQCLKNNSVKYESNEYYKAQYYFFGGASMAINDVPARWGICLMARRPIIEKYAL